ncbi:hypothetical protein L6258_02950 [Candidatus Parcubacteria bacterium]|nr:hypothetical protein [Candidatus Parcubacteria bacterium]
MKEINGLTEKVTSLYAGRVKRADKLKREVRTILRRFRQEEKEIVAKLKDLLTQNQSLRKNDFDLAMKKILGHHREREKEIGEKLSEFQQAEEEMAGKLKKLFGGKQRPAIENLRSLALSLQERQGAKAEEVRSLLDSFSESHVETAKALRKLLEKGEKIKIKDFKKMVAQLKIQQTQKQDEVRKALLEFRSELEERVGKLREELVSGEMAKKAEFEKTAANILANQEKTSSEATGVLKEVRVMLKAFQDEMHQTESRLREKLAA